MRAQLVHVGETTKPTRRMVHRKDLSEKQWKIAEVLAEKRLAVIDWDRQDRSQHTVELAHEALITEWDRLHQWIENDRDFVIWRERLRAALDQWRRNGRKRGTLLNSPMVGHGDQVEGVAFSPDGTLIASASLDHTVRLWDAATGQSVGQPLAAHTGWVESVAFSPDGNVIAVAIGQTVRLQPLDTDEWVRHACALAGRNLRQEEWDEFVGHDRPYVRTCPELPSGYGAPAGAPAARYELN